MWHNAEFIGLFLEADFGADFSSFFSRAVTKCLYSTFSVAFDHTWLLGLDCERLEAWLCQTERHWVFWTKKWTNGKLYVPHGGFAAAREDGCF